ncbi:UDP-N-acetyl-D-glucosamine dehydrogenase [Paenibacillus sp. CCS19]|uniref:nucleotide sugar dehydrogenase n=1 Tax=Paenibacillus sp. CCS19 TaxID=3158387 RepID=UPI0025643FF6|nr:nucleotide sugar dehydrogenase [Paenibacillus cellulosilyticus]GMK40014.1 UDP-N-acetyl-D-glucosamine dehydrogenase [Paenibacillus cellulosilyticus]
MHDKHAVSAYDRYVYEAGKVGVIGLGYVGLPLAMACIRSGLQVIGIEIDERKLSLVKDGKSYIQDISDEELTAAVRSGQLAATADYSQLMDVNGIVICVPTPLTEEHTPDVSFITNTCVRLRDHLQPGQLVVVESTTYPGTTRELVQPLLEQGGLTAGVHFHLAYSPERIDPGNHSHKLQDVPKIVSGVSSDCLTRVTELYGRIFRHVVPVSSTDIAEAAKLLENSFRLINISFINEFAKLCDELQLNIWEVIEAASTKPYGFMPFQPGPGIGGHCIPVDPLYLQWSARRSGTESRFIELSHHTNETMPRYIVNRIARLLGPDRTLSGASILLIGIAYKKNIADMRESSALTLIRLLQQEGADVSYYDPYVPSVRIGASVLHSVELTDETLNGAGCVVIHTDHACLPIERIVENAAVLYDARNATRGMKSAGRLERLGGGTHTSRRSRQQVSE